MSLLFVKTNKKMMTRSKTINAANAVANATNATNTATVVANADATNADAPIVYPSMFDRWRLPL
jgi:hypothetical protein